MRNETNSIKGFVCGDFFGETRSELGKNIVNGLSLGLPSDENIGKRVRFKNPTCRNEEKIHTLICRQMAWGYDENGIYKMIPAYRGVYGEDDNFGRPIHLREVEFVD